MNNQDFSKLFDAHVLSLSHRDRFRIAVAICKELYPRYHDFHHRTGWGDADFILDVIMTLDRLETCTLPRTDLRRLANRVDENFPDIDDFYEEHDARYACASVFETCHFCLDKDIRHLETLGIYLECTLDLNEMYDLPKEELARHPMMIKAKNILLGAELSQNQEKTSHRS